MATRWAMTLSRNQHGLLGLMLLLLHGAIWWDFGSPLSRSLALAHLGAFLMWQPLWQQDRRLKPRNGAVFVLVTAAAVYWLNWWLVFIWLILLVGLLGGRVFLDRRERLAYLVALVVVICELLVGCVMPMFSIPPGQENVALLNYGLMALILALFFIPDAPTQGADGHQVDPIHGLTLAFLTTILVLGSLLVMYATRVEYPVALFETILVMAGFLLVMSWLLSPRLAFGGLAQLWNRYLLNIGTPFEEWLTKLSGIAQREDSPKGFLDAAMGQLLELGWIRGVGWESANGTGEAGARTPHETAISTLDLNVSLYTQRPPGATLRFHSRLLVHLIGHFHTSKRAQEQLAHNAHLRAIHETGARITHDIKNLLQSLHTLTAAVEMTGPEKAADLQKLMQRQLPHLSHRLQCSLEKLRAPRKDAVEYGRLADWWQRLQARNNGQAIAFRAELNADPDVPAECFDSVAENLLENAKRKREADPGVEIRIELVADEEQVRLVVCDSGAPIDDARAESLFRSPVSSAHGLGVGLYQAGQQANQHGYDLKLLRNDQAGVCFELASGPERLSSD